MEIITNYQWRNFLYGYEIPETVLNSDFDYLDDDEKTDGFIKYRGRYYHVSGFMLLPEHCDIPNDWQGIEHDSAFSGVLVRLSDDGEQYQIATYIS
ncbi:hypothetical protein [Marinobacter sp. DS40M6]|uniref:hypothetical protein n=1 Tax=Marinobacter sp. DS40M6 TaxID=1597776 RepID=UPI0023587A65|nr:hypothetical protein [Marinobacter sp. DS40M6]MDC8457855.1 hypothetical protein [Marinobacter sp. DS40M6]